jgi:hypothetical protein
MRPNCCAEAFGGEGHERLGRRAHQETVDRLLVLESDLSRRRRQGEDDVEVGNRQQLSLTSGEPLRARRPLTLPAMAVSARVVNDAGEPAIVAALDMTTERAVRQAVIAPITRRSARPRCPAFARS